MHPAQHYLDSQPVADAQCVEGSAECDDMSFTAADGDTTFSDAIDDPHLDNFADPEGIDGRWTFDYGCLTAEVLSMAGQDTIQLEDDLTADVRLTGGEGCQAYDVAATGRGGPAVDEDVPAVADIAVKQTRRSRRRGRALRRVRVLRQPGTVYDWDFGDGTSDEARPAANRRACTTRSSAPGATRSR